jgi:hypothetical protein
MNTKIVFENHFSARVVEVLFPDGLNIKTEQDLLYIKNEWVKNLKSWHSPYTCLFDCSNFQINKELIPQFNKMIQFFSNFFMRKIIGFCESSSELPELNFEIIVGYDNAKAKTNLVKDKFAKKDLENFRSRILIDNDFNAHVIEVQFAIDTEINTKEDIGVLKDKLKNNLRQWHSPYSILINCVNCSFSQEAAEEFKIIEKFLKTFFCKQIIGYAPKVSKELYPFQTYRSRHLAAAELENNGLQSGAIANCSTRK